MPRLIYRRIPKHLFLWLLTASLSPLTAQPFGRPAPGYRTIELHYTNSSGENGISEYYYDCQGRLTQGIWYLVDSSRSSINSYQYDVTGNLRNAFREFSDSLSSFETFEYDEDGNKIAERFFRSDGRTGSARHMYVDGRPSVSFLHNHKGWLSGTLKYTPDKFERPVSAILLNRDTVPICQVSYQYDPTGNLAVESWDFNGRWQQEFKYVYIEAHDPCLHYSMPYLDNCAGQRIKKEHYSFNGELGGPSYYTYDEQGRLSEKIFIRSDSLKTNTHYTYDQTGRLVSSVRSYHDGRVINFSYTYDDRNRLIRREGSIADSLFSMEAYRYEGELLSEAFYLRHDGWLNGNVRFIHDPGKEIQGGRFSGTDGIDADIVIGVTPSGLVEKVRWIFSSGDFQEYTFEY